MTVLQSFPPEICSLICQDPILGRFDLNSICFISHAFRNEAQRELSNHFPCFRGDDSVKAWYRALERKPHLATKIKGLVLYLPCPSTFGVISFLHLTFTLYRCKNLKELAVFFEEQPEHSWMPISFFYPFKLTKFVNGYFVQDNLQFTSFLKSQPNLESLELHSGKTDASKNRLSFQCLKTLGCSPQFLNTSYSVTRLRLDFKNSMDDCEIDELGRALDGNLTKNMKSLAIFLNQRQSHFAEIIRVIAASHICIQHLEIHQFLPTQVEEDLPLPINSYGQDISLRTLVFRPPPGLPEKAGDNPDLCAYVELRTPTGRRKIAEELIMRTLPTLTRLVLVVHGNDYEFQRNLPTGVITGEVLITRDKREWAFVN